MMVQPLVQPTPAGTTPSSISMADQRVCDRLQTAMQRSGNPGRGEGGGGSPGGGGGPIPATAAQGPVSVAAAKLVTFRKPT